MCEHRDARQVWGRLCGPTRLFVLSHNLALLITVCVKGDNDWMTVGRRTPETIVGCVGIKQCHRRNAGVLRIGQETARYSACSAGDVIVARGKDEQHRLCHNR